MASGLDWQQIAQSVAGGAKVGLAPVLDPSGMGAVIRDNAPALGEKLKQWMSAGQAQGKTMDEMQADLRKEVEKLTGEARTPRETTAEFTAKAEGLGGAMSSVARNNQRLQLDGLREGLPLRGQLDQLDLKRAGGYSEIQKDFNAQHAGLQKDVYGFQADTATKNALALMEQSGRFGSASQDRVLGGYTLKDESDRFYGLAEKQLNAGVELARRGPGLVGTIQSLAPVGLLLASVLGGLS